MSHRLRSLALAALVSSTLSAASAAPASAAISNVSLPSVVDGAINSTFGFSCTSPFDGVPVTFNSNAAGKLFVYGMVPKAFPSIGVYPIKAGANRVQISFPDISIDTSGPLTSGRVTVHMLPLDRYGFPNGGLVTRKVTLRCTTGIGTT